MGDEAGQNPALKNHGGKTYRLGGGRLSPEGETITERHVHSDKSTVMGHAQIIFALPEQLCDNPDELLASLKAEAAEKRLFGNQGQANRERCKTLIVRNKAGKIEDQVKAVADSGTVCNVIKRSRADRYWKFSDRIAEFLKAERTLCPLGETPLKLVGVLELNLTECGIEGRSQNARFYVADIPGRDIDMIIGTETAKLFDWNPLTSNMSRI